MKKSILNSAAIFSYCLLVTAYCFSQGTAINSTGAPADNSAMLDVSSSSKGLLCPRMTTAQINSVSSPAIGLFVYNTDISCFQYWTGSLWLNDCGSQSSGSAVTAPCVAVGGFAAANPGSGTCGFTATLTVTGYFGNIQWQRSTDGVFFSDITGAQTSVYNTTIIDTVIYFVAKVNVGTCVTGYSNVVKVTSAGCPSLYCMTVGWTNPENGKSIIQTSDGSYAAAGYTTSFGAGNYDMYIVKLDKSGGISWIRTIGGTNVDLANSIIQTSDGGYAVVGNTRSYGAGSDDVYVVKLDAAGNILWTKTIGGSDIDYGYSIVQTSDGGYVIAGETLNYGAGLGDIYVVKLDGSGNKLWTKTVGGTKEDRAYSMTKTSDGGFAICGYTVSFGSGNTDVYIVKLDGTGNLLWSKVVGGTNYETGYSIIQASDGGYAVAGYSSSYPGGGNSDFYVIKLDGSGNVSWKKTYGGAQEEWSYSIVQSNDGGYVVGGHSETYGGLNYPDMLAVKIDGSGNLQWARSTGGSGNDVCNSVVKSSDGGYGLLGNTNSFGAGDFDMYFVKLDASGNSCCAVARTPSVGSGGNESSGGAAGSGGGAESSGGMINIGGTKISICK